MLTSWSQSRPSQANFAADLQLIDELADALRLTSICGLGQILPAPVASVLKYFREEVEAHLTRRECPSGICFSSAAAARAVAAAPMRMA